MSEVELTNDCKRLNKRVHELRIKNPTQTAEDIYAELVDTYSSLVSSVVRYGTNSFQYREGREDQAQIDTIYIFSSYDGIFAWLPLTMVKSGSSAIQDLVTNDVHEEMNMGERERKVELNDERVCVFAKVPIGKRSKCNSSLGTITQF